MLHLHHDFKAIKVRASWHNIYFTLYIVRFTMMHWNSTINTQKCNLKLDLTTYCRHCCSSLLYNSTTTNSERTDPIRGSLSAGFTKFTCKLLLPNNSRIVRAIYPRSPISCTESISLDHNVNARQNRCALITGWAGKCGAQRSRHQSILERQGTKAHLGDEAPYFCKSLWQYDSSIRVRNLTTEKSQSKRRLYATMQKQAQRTHSSVS